MGRDRRSTAQPSHLDLERMGDAPRVAIASKRAPSPLGRLGCQAVGVRIFHFEHGMDFSFPRATACRQKE